MSRARLAAGPTIEGGQIKLFMLSSEGKKCLLAIHGAGDIFGELWLSGLGLRLETAPAMKPTTLKQIPSSQFLARLSRDSLFEGFVRYLAVRVADPTAGTSRSRTPVAGVPIIFANWSNIRQSPFPNRLTIVYYD
jgi:Cyclic nucleotide-binding domain